MINFMEYMLFSGFEYLAIFVLILSLFNIDYKYYRIELITGTIVSTLISYFVVLFGLQEYILLTAIITLVSFFHLAFKQKLARSFVISLAGYSLYVFIQLILINALDWLNVVTVDDLSVTFSTKTYILQTLCACLAITIGIYIKLTNGGFGFAMKRVKGRTGFLYASSFLLIVCSLCCLGYYMFETIALITVSLIAFFVSVLVIFFLSYKRDVAEYS